MARTRTKKDAPKRSQGNLKKVGALWVSKGKNGTFLSGRVDIDDNTEMRVLVFKNSYKDEGERRPDYIIYEPEDTDKDTDKGNAATNDDIPF